MRRGSAALVRAILLLAGITLGFGLTLPSMTIEPDFGEFDGWVRLLDPNLTESSTYSVLSGIMAMFRHGNGGIGLLLLGFSVFFPVTKIALMAAAVEALSHHKLILLTHASEPVGHSYQGKGGITPDVLYPFIEAHPRLTIVCGHWGGGLPFYNLMPEVKKATKNVYFDTAASPFLYTPDIYNHVIKLVGPDKILFGSDYPLMPHRRLLEEIEALDVNQETKDLMLSGNARRLLGIKNES